MTIRKTMKTKCNFNQECPDSILTERSFGFYMLLERMFEDMGEQNCAIDEENVDSLLEIAIVSKLCDNIEVIPFTKVPPMFNN